VILDRLLDDDAVWHRVLLFAPHPDDESLAAGGLLHRAVARGSTIRVVFATDGENNPWPQRALERRVRIDARARARWGLRRRAEALSALAALGVASSSVRFLRLPDRGLTDLLLAGDQGPTAQLADEIATLRPTLLLAPAPTDRHRDHGALAVFTQLALAERPSTARRCLQLAYVVHGRPVEPTAVRMVLTRAELERKRVAIGCHASQLALSSRRFLAHATIAESFVEPGAATPRHRVDAVLPDHAGVRLVFARDASPRLPVPATLDLVALGADGSVVGRSIPVWPWTRTVRVPLPARPLAVHARLERPRPFLDRDGWRCFPLPVERESVAAQIARSRPAQYGSRSLRL